MNLIKHLYILTVSAKKRAGDTILNIIGVPSEAEEDDIELYFTNKCWKLGGGEVEVLSFSVSDNTAVVCIKQLSSEGN